MYTNKAGLKEALEALPINSLVVLAAELGSHTDQDMPRDKFLAIDSLCTDVLNVACERLGKTNENVDGFMQAVSWWGLSHKSREWYQRIISHSVTD